MLTFADLFCGAGGTTAGAESSGAARAVCAVNHWQTAVDTHSRNFPNCRHINSRIDQVNPSECPPIRLLFASPECTHHSRARGGRPTSDQQRSGAWDLMRWIDHHRPQWIVVENVPEFASWGPVGRNGIPLSSRRGAFYDAWRLAIESAGYTVDSRILNAADYGAHTSRDRLFVVARLGRKSVPWPDPSHTRRPGGELPGMSLPRWRPASEVIDWSIPCPSIFTRKRPLAEKTLARIEAGLRKFVGPVVVQWDNTGGRGAYCRPVDSVLATLVTKANMGVAVPFTVEVNHGGDDSRTGDLVNPLGAVSTKNGRGLAVPYVTMLRNNSTATDANDPVATITASGAHHGLTVPFIVPHFGERNGQTPRCHAINTPSPTITGQGAGSLVVPFLCHYYGSENISPVSDPVDTITTRDRHGLAEVSIVRTMRELRIVDVGFRMLQPHELAAAQGFRRDYVFCGSKSDVTRQIGNSVSPPVARALTTAIASV